MSNPLVSICVPTRDRAAYLRESLRSIQTQDYEPFEILISDNASEDGTEAFCREAARSDPRIRYVRQPHNLGLYGNHNFLIEQARGEFLCFFHDHDSRDAGIIRAYVDFLRAHPRVGAVCSDWELTDAEGKRLGTRRYPVSPVTPGMAYVEQTLRSGRSSLAAPGALIRREALNGIRFDEKGPLGFGDFVVWFRIAERWEIGHIPRVLWACRQDPRAQSTRTIVSMVEDYDVNLNRYCDEYLRRSPARGAQVRRWRKHIRRYLFWALAFEVGLHFRDKSSTAERPPQTLFELFNYRLSPEAFGQTLERLRSYRSGWQQQAVFQVLQGLIRFHITRPLAWATAHTGFFRNFLGLQERLDSARRIARAARDAGAGTAAIEGNGLSGFPREHSGSAESPARNPQCVLCFSTIDWDFIWQGHQEIMSALARQGDRVLFVENTGVRDPRLRDFSRVRNRFRKWRRSIQGFWQAEKNLHVYSPLILPFPYAGWARWINRALMGSALRRWMVAADFYSPICWTFLPTPLTLDLIRQIPHQALVYYCIDSFADSTPAAQRILPSEEVLFREADLVFVTSQALLERALGFNRNVHFFPFGVNFEEFDRARAAPDGIPPELEKIPGPRIGYIGGIHQWVDQELLVEAARSLRDCTFVLIGPEQTDVHRLKSEPNILLLGQKPHDLLPRYIKHFDAGIIPYRLSPYTRNVYPTKLSEYHALGVPVVSTPLPEILAFNRRHSDLVKVGGTGREFGEALKKALVDSSSVAHALRVESARASDWTGQIGRMLRHIDRVIAEKQASHSADWPSRLRALWDQPRWILRWSLGAAFSLLLLFHTPLVWFLAEPLRVRHEARPADAIVVFAGGVGESGEAGDSYQERVQQAIRLYHAGYASTVMLVSSDTWTFDEVQVMRAICKDLGVPSDALLTERRVLNTFDYVTRVNEAAEGRSWDSILLITSPYHARRALLTFQKNAPELTVLQVSKPTSSFYARSGWGISPKQMHGLLHEWLGILYYRFRGWI